MTVEPLPEHVAALLGERAGAEAARRLCVRSIDHAPNSLQDSWYPMWLALEVPALGKRRDIAQGTTRLLAERGYVQSAFWDQNTARMPNAEETRLLSLASGTPVLEHRRTGFTSDRRPVRVSLNVFAGDRSLVAYTLGDAAALPAGQS